MKILLTNDDGIESSGINALVSALAKDHDCHVVAPKGERSASSHAISLGQKLRVETFVEKGVKQYAVHGTPVDCIKFALYELTDFRPDLIISGINQGANTGVSVYYSGTISAAREGVINRVPSIAVSLCSKEVKDFEAAQDIAKKIIKAYENKTFPPEIMLNVNVPPIPKSKIRGVRIAKQASSRFVEEFTPEKKHGKIGIYTLAGEIELLDPDGTSDEEAIVQGYISITPLKLDLTDYESMYIYQNWVKNGSTGP